MTEETFDYDDAGRKSAEVNVDIGPHDDLRSGRPLETVLDQNLNKTLIYEYDAVGTARR